MSNTWYENTMCFDSNGNFNLCDDYDDTYREDIYIQCSTCNEMTHPSNGQHDNKDNFICEECIELLDKEYQENQKLNQ